MTLVERLRAAQWRHGRNVVETMHEAADRIEALEEALREARVALQKGVTGGDLTHICRVIDAALSGKDLT